MRTILKSLLLLELLFIFTGCFSQRTFKTEEINVIQPTIIRSNQANVSVAPSYREYEIEIPLNGEMGSFTSYGNKIYYFVLFREPMSNVAKSCSLYEYDVNEKESQLLYEFQDPKVTHVNELRADNENLYWTAITDSDYILQRYHLIDQKMDNLHQVKMEPDGLPIVLGDTSKYLGWYEYNPISQKDQLMMCSLDSGTVKTVLKDVTVHSTYDRTSIFEDEILITVQDNGTEFCLINLNTLQQAPLFHFVGQEKVINPHFNQSYLVWQNEYTNGDIYIYNRNTQDIVKLDCSQIGNDLVFSQHLLGNDIYINDGYGDIWIYNIPKNEVYCTTIDASSPKHFYGGNIAMDGRFIIKSNDDNGTDRVSIY